MMGDVVAGGISAADWRAATERFAARHAGLGTSARRPASSASSRSRPTKSLHRQSHRLRGARPRKIRRRRGARHRRIGARADRAAHCAARAVVELACRKSSVAGSRASMCSTTSIRTPSLRCSTACRSSGRCSSSHRSRAARRRRWRSTSSFVNGSRRRRKAT